MLIVLLDTSLTAMAQVEVSVSLTGSRELCCRQISGMQHLNLLSRASRDIKRMIVVGMCDLFCFDLAHINRLPVNMNRSSASLEKRKA